MYSVVIVAHLLLQPNNHDGIIILVSLTFPLFSPPPLLPHSFTLVGGCEKVCLDDLSIATFSEHHVVFDFLLSFNNGCSFSYDDCIYIPHTMRGMGVYNELRFWATATGAASRERREETAREEEGGNSESAACSKCGYVCHHVCLYL